MKSLKTHLKEKSYGPQDTGLGKDEWKSKLKQHHPDVEFTNVSGKDHESHEAHIPWGKDKRRVGVWTDREKGGPHHSIDFARLATKEETQIDEISKGTLQSYTLKALGQSHAAQNKYIATPGKEGIEALKKSKKREAGIEKAEKKIDKMSEEALDEVSTSTLKSYLKSNLKKTVEKDGQPNPPLFKLKARAKGMETAISKLMKKEAVEEVDEKWSVYDTKTKEVHSTHASKSKAEKVYNQLNQDSEGYKTPGGLIQGKYGMKKQDFKEAVSPIHPAVKALGSVPHTEYKATVTFHDGTSKAITMKGTGGQRGALGHISNHYANRGMKVKDVKFTSIKPMQPVKEEALDEVNISHFTVHAFGDANKKLGSSTHDSKKQADDAGHNYSALGHVVVQHHKDGTKKIATASFEPSVDSFSKSEMKSKALKEEALDEVKNAHFVHVHDSEDVLSAHNMIHSKAEAIAKKNNGKVTRVSNVKTNIEYPGGHSTTITTKKEDGRVKSDINHIYEAMVYDPFTKKMVPTMPIKIKMGGGATRNGVPVETGLSKYKQRLPMSKAAAVLAAEEHMMHSIGDQVRCTKTNRLATVTGVENDQYTVAYGDGSTQTADASYWAPIRKANESRTFRSIREAACQTPVYTSYYKGRKLHFCGSKGKSASSKSGGSFSSSNISGEGGAGSGNGGGDGGGGNGGGGM